MICRILPKSIGFYCFLPDKWFFIIFHVSLDYFSQTLSISTVSLNFCKVFLTLPPKTPLPPNLCRGMAPCKGFVAPWPWARCLTNPKEESEEEWERFCQALLYYLVEGELCALTQGIRYRHINACDCLNPTPCISKGWVSNSITASIFIAEMFEC